MRTPTDKGIDRLLDRIEDAGARFIESPASWWFVAGLAALSLACLAYTLRGGQ